MDEWTLAINAPAVLVTVAIGEGSVPRGPGTRMMVAADSFAGTVGGGHLELRAIEIGRAMLIDGRARHFERFPLGPSLGQCCGGVVHLAFERFDAATAALFDQRRRSDSWKATALDAPFDLAVFDAGGAPLAGQGAPAFERSRGTHMVKGEDGRRWLIAAIDAPRHHLMLFGAGHVGTALIRALAPLPCTVTWVDERAELFPLEIPANVQVEAADAPEDLVAAAPAGASYLVMTHSHALDQRVTEAILAREQVGWFGLIGSKTKRMQFEHRLRARGVAEQRIAAMACPIGLPGITGKEPAVIAASVSAQLLMLWETAALAKIETTSPLRLVGIA